MSHKLLVADLLCGAGGSSTGCERALAEMGLSMELVCVNHWPVAIDTHTRNHPHARHYVQDIATVRPHLIVPEGYLDLLMASPTCTHHSVARGGKPTSDQQRSDPWHIITWVTELLVKRLIIENVWEFTSWGPVNPKTGRPIQERKGEYFNAWIDTLRRLGFDPEWRKLNAADYGDATTRQRFILMARNDKRPVVWPVPTHRKTEKGKRELFPGLKPWRPARDIIDWSIKGKSIFNRKKPLAAKTLARIEAGAIKFGWPEPFLVILRNHMAGRSVDTPLPTLTASGGHVGLAQPVILTVAHGNEAGENEPNARRAKSISDPLGSVHGSGSAYGIVEPFILSRHSCGAPRGVDDPTPTQTTVHSPVLISPYYGSGSGETCQTAEQPPATVTSKARFSMVVPVTNGSGGPATRSVSDPVPTMTTAKGGEFAFVMPVTHAGGVDRAQDVDAAPLPTITGANRGELAFIAAQFGERDGQAPRVHSVDQPSPAICATGHVNLVQATPEYDILFRMLEPHELAAAMGFTTDETSYEFAGTKTEQIKQIGNAVSVAKMKACVSALMSDAVLHTPSCPGSTADPPD